MNEYQKQQSLKILQSYSNDIEKGGKRAEIGEVRITGGKMRIKHPEGWLYQNKDGSYYLVKNDGTKKQATSSDILFAQKHIKQQDIQSVKSAFRKNPKKEAPIQRQVGKKLSLNHSVKSEADRLKSLTKHALQISKEVVNSVLSEAENRFKENNVTLTPKNRALYKIGITYEMLGALSRYAKDTDKIIAYNISTSHDRVELELLVDRDGEEHIIKNSVIEAGGHNIQIWHTRMNITSTLPKNEKESIEDLIKESGDKELKSEISILTNSYDAMKKILTLKRQPLRFTALVDKYDTVKSNVEKLPDDNKEFLYKLVDDYTNDKLILSGYDSEVKEFLKTIHQKAALRLSQDISRKVELRGLDATPDDEAVFYFKTALSGHSVYKNEDQSLKEILLNRLKSKKNSYLNQSKYYPEAEIKRVYKESPLEFDLGKVSVLSNKLKYNKDTKTFIADRQIKDLLSKTPINYINKNITLYNPKTGKEEEFSYKGIDNNGIVFTSKNKLTLLIKKK